jgi:hypothetical protein
MQDTINLIDAVVTEDSEPTAEVTTESQLSEEIGELWSIHIQATSTINRTKAELRTIRLDLGARLCEMKKLLSRPGRNGQWSSWLQERGIARATADRLAKRYAETLGPDANRLTEAIPEATEEAVQKVFASVWPKLRRTLTTPSSLHHFIVLFSSHYECCEMTEARHSDSQTCYTDDCSSVVRRGRHC